MYVVHMVCMWCTWCVCGAHGEYVVPMVSMWCTWSVCMQASCITCCTVAKNLRLFRCFSRQQLPSP